MAKLRFTQKAVDDLTNIWNYTSIKLSEEQRDKYYHMLIDNCKQVASNPDLGKDYSAVVDHLMGFKAGRHIIFYRKIESNKVEITRILHEQMDIKNRIE